MPLLHTTKSLCPVCLKTLPASIMEEGDTVRLKRSCPDHGEFSAVIWRGEPRLAEWSRPKTPSSPGHRETSRDKGCPYDCGLCEEHTQHTCTVLFEITGACNLRCPVCFASSGSEAHKAFTPLAELLAQLRWIHSRAPEVVLQISGGEPTLHPDLVELTKLGAKLFPAVQLNTNGLKLAQSPDLCGELAKAGLSWVFLQFDGTSDEIYRIIRGRELFAEKLKAVENCRKAGLGVVLVPTLVRGVNDAELGNILNFALDGAPDIRGIHIQPMADMGRNMLDDNAKERITLPEVLTMLEEQSGGRIKKSHASPPGCEHERCSFHCRYFLGPDNAMRPVREGACCTALATGAAFSAQVQAPPKALPHDNEKKNLPAGPLDRQGQNNHANGADKAINTIIRSWGRASPLGEFHAISDEDELTRFIRQAREKTFSVTCMAFQDALTADIERLQGCCVHIYAPPARLVPFCAYNLTSVDGTPLHRGKQ